MITVCSKCHVGGHYIFIVEENNYICLECKNVLTSKLQKKYKEQRLQRCLYPRRQRLKTKNI